MKEDSEIKSVREIIEKNIILQGADLLSARGFTQVPNHILKGSLSPGAKLAYAMVLSYAWHNNFAFPGQKRLADDMGVSERSVIRYMQELQKTKNLGINSKINRFGSLDEEFGRPGYQGNYLHAVSWRRPRFPNRPRYRSSARGHL